MAMLKLSPFARGPNRFKPFKLRAVPTPPGILNIAGNATSTTANLTIPSSVLAGDVLVLLDRVDGSTTAVFPAGFTTINNVVGTTARQIVSYKLADGTEAGTSITGMSGTIMSKILYVIRANPKITTVTVASVNGQMSTTGDPTPQVVTAGSGTAPLAVFAAFCSSGTPASNTFVPGPARQTISLSSNSSRFSCSIFDLSPYNITADKGSDNLEEGLQSFYLQFGTTVANIGVAAITEAGDTLASTAALAIAAAAAITEANDTLASAASTTLNAAFAQTEANDTLTSAAKLDIAAAFSRTEANDTLTSAASTTLSGAFAKTEANDTLSADSTMGLAPILADLARTEANDTLLSTSTFLDLRPGIWREPATASSSWTETPAEGDVWTEEASNPGGWSELSTRSNSWTEEGSESNGWTEELP